MDEKGEHVIVFPTRARDFMPPANYDERLAWIRSSFDSFFTVVKEKDSVKQLCTKA